MSLRMMTAEDEEGELSEVGKWNDGDKKSIGRKKKKSEYGRASLL